ncbi:uncharacterized protein LOC107174334 [Citrus sinensis]|uniref:uncharacterized protein LOC107174334 n=1 Tax=Citrus sinensis TaxID=2711 RepID=UPI0007636590|nr:uncharacterized protein LOC107174334 [Citrus sinensis]
MADPHGSPTTESWVNVGCHVLPSGSGHGETVVISSDYFTISNRRGKLIVDESVEEVDDSYPNLLRPTDPPYTSSSVGPSYNRDTSEYHHPKTILHSLDFEPMGNRGGQVSGSGENHSSEGAKVPEEEGDGEESSSEPRRPSKKRSIGHRMKADAYPIDYIACATTHTGLLKLRNLYNIHEDILLAIPGKCDVPSRLPKGYVTLHLESFKLGARLLLQPYFARILCGMHLALDLWGLIKRLDDELLLKVEIALVNTSTCHDLMSSTNLVGSCLVDVAAGMDNKILSAMLKKGTRGSGDSNNPPPPLKKTNVGSSKAPAPALPPSPRRKNGGEKVCDKSPEISIQSGDRSSPLPLRDQGDYLTLYQRDYGKSVGPKMVKDIESMSLNELVGSVQMISFKLATLVSCYKNMSTRHERKLQAENQDLKKKVESADRSREKLLDLHKQIIDLEEKVVIAASNSSKLESEFGDLKSDL